MTSEAPAPSDEVSRLLRAGVAAAKAGQREAARQLLLRVVDLDERNVAGWLWLSSVVESLDDREVCLENVLTLEPEHVAARRGLALLRQQRAAASPPPPPPPPPDPPHATPAGAILAQKPLSEPACAFAVSGTSAPAETAEAAEPAISAGTDEFAGDYRCPYCAAQTQPADRRCPACAGDLWVRYRRRERPSYWLGLAMAFQALLIIAGVFLLSVILASIATAIKLTNPYLLIPFYLGLADWPAPEMQSAALALLAPTRLLGMSIPLFYALGVFIGLGYRWKPAFHAFLIQSALVLVASMVLLFLPKPGPTIGIGGLVASAILFFLITQMEDDFFFDQRRLVLALDKDVKSGLSLLQRGQLYAGRSMWAMAVIHLQRAVGKMPDKVDPYLALAAASANMRRLDLAEKALTKARQLDPTNAELLQLEAALAAAQAQRTGQPASDKAT